VFDKNVSRRTIPRANRDAYVSIGNDPDHFVGSVYYGQDSTIAAPQQVNGFG